MLPSALCPRSLVEELLPLDNQIGACSKQNWPCSCGLHAFWPAASAFMSPHLLRGAADGKAALIGYAIAQMEGPHSCATACEEHTECTGFDYHKAFRRCVLKRGSGRDVMFDRDGWQTYWHEQHFEDWHARGRLDFLRQLLFRLFGFLF